MTEPTFKDYKVGEQAELIEAQELCEKIDFSLNTKNNNALEYHNTIYHQIVNQEMENRTPVNEILEILGETVKEAVNDFLANEKNNAKEKYAEVCNDTSFDFTVDDYGLSFKMDCKGTEYLVCDAPENSVKNIIKCVTLNSYNNKEKEMIDYARTLCEQIDLDLHGEPEQLYVYGKVATQDMQEGSPVEDVLDTLGEEIKETVDLYIAVEIGNCEERYEKEVYADTSFDFTVDENGLKLSLECNGEDYAVEHCGDIRKIIDETLDEARDEHEADDLDEDEEWEYDD